MVVLPLSRMANDSSAYAETPQADAADSADSSMNWIRIAAATSLVTGGALLLSGKRRSGLLVAATGTALALLDQQDTLGKWWSLLPAYIDSVQQFLDQAEGAVEELAAQREKLGQILGR
jgi:uncharacterized membrane protein YdfJ with MMPL/SSD domain